MTLREFAALSLLLAPFVGLLALWTWWVRGVPAKNRENAAKREAALALPVDRSLSIGLSRGGIEHLVFSVAPMLAIAATGLSLPLLLMFGYLPGAKVVLSAGLLICWWSCYGLWKYARTSNRASALYLSSDGLQMLSSTRLLWHDVEAVHGREWSGGYGIYRAVRNTVTVTLRPHIEPCVRTEGGFFLRQMMHAQKLEDGRVSLTLNVTNLEDWATVDVLLRLMRMRLDAHRLRTSPALPTP